MGVHRPNWGSGQHSVVGMFPFEGRDQLARVSSDMPGARNEADDMQGKKRVELCGNLYVLRVGNVN